MSDFETQDPALNHRVMVMESGIDPCVFNLARQVAVVLVTRLSTENASFGVLKYSARIVETAPVTQPCPAGYSGWLGVFASGNQFGSAVRAGLPPPTGIADTGRQKLKLNFAFQQPMAASAYPAHSMAMSRAVSEVSSPFWVARFRKARAYCWPVCSVQKSPISVCWVVRTVLLRAPRAFTWL
jgi:hypothetical protein